MTLKELEAIWTAFLEENYSDRPKLKDILLESAVFESDDEFVILLPALKSWGQVHWMREKLLDKLRLSFYSLPEIWEFNVTIAENPFYPPNIILYD